MMPHAHAAMAEAMHDRAYKVFLALFQEGFILLFSFSGEHFRESFLGFN